MADMTDTGDNRPSVYEENGVWVYRASALGSCLRSLLYARRGLEPAPTPDWLQTAFDQGHAHEQTILDQFTEDQGYRLEGAQQEIELRISPTAMVRGHLDSSTRMAVGRCVVDAKALAEVTYEKVEKGWPVYDWQLAAYCAAIEADQWCIAAGIKDPDDGWKLKAFRYLWGTPKYTKADIVKRVLTIERHAKDGTEPDCPDPLDYPCPFYYLHQEKKWVDLTGDDLDQLEIAWEMNCQVRELEDRVKKLKKDRNDIVEKLVQVHGPRIRTKKVRQSWVPESEVPAQTIERKAYTKAGYPKFLKGDDDE